MKIYNCDKCTKKFVREKIIKKGRAIHCDDCKINKSVHFKDINTIKSILELSTRTVTKIIVRAKLKCPLCGWDKSTLDLHHIQPKKYNGSNNHDNLAPVCPNCHRMIHNNLYTIEQIKNISLDKLLINWKDYYYPGDGVLKIK